MDTAPEGTRAADHRHSPSSIFSLDILSATMDAKQEGSAMSDPDRLLTVHEAAARLRLDPETIRRWLRDGRLSGIWLGSDKAGWRISEQALAAYIVARTSERKGSRHA
jgi:excisionase family DNA binding protein